jgi:hypothetical protein
MSCSYTSPQNGKVSAFSACLSGQTSPGTEAGSPTARPYVAPPSPASSTSTATSCGAHDFGCAPRSTLDSTRTTRGPSIHNFGRATCGSSIPTLPAALLMSPSGCVRAIGTASTSAVAVSKDCTGGSSGQPSPDDHAGEVGLPASGFPPTDSPCRSLRRRPYRRCPPPSAPPSSI